MPDKRSALVYVDRTCPEPGGCATCPDPAYCRTLRLDAGVTTEAQESAAASTGGEH